MFTTRARRPSETEDMLEVEFILDHEPEPKLLPQVLCLGATNEQLLIRDKDIMPSLVYQLDYLYIIK